MKTFLCSLLLMTSVAVFPFSARAADPVEVYPGVWRFTFATPEKITPTSTRHYPPASAGLAALTTSQVCPVTVSASLSDRGVLIRVPLDSEELIYGLGLQLQSFQQRALKKMLRVNADPAMDTGDSHAPVPFYVTTRGYGVFVDTARYATFYLGNKVKAPTKSVEATPAANPASGANIVPLYHQSKYSEKSEVLVEIPRATGVDVYVFAGPSMREAVQRYNLFSGGGVLPPRWGLGFWYRAQTDFSQDDVLKLADEFRERRIPCDVLGLEPHWQSHAYSSSYLWSDHFPKPADLVRSLLERHFRLNLWEQGFVDTSSPIHKDLLTHTGDYQVWGGLVPDFLGKEARQIFADFHEREHVALGVSGYKADECDNSDLTGNWSFPEISRFPSGADGEQMHSLFGLRYQDTLQSIFEKRSQRTYGLVRSSGALAAPYPYVLYSDLYDHGQFVHGIAQSSFSGLLWTPEVREASTPEELVRRLQAVAFSPLAMINAWYLKNPPWKQVNREANNTGKLTPDWETAEAQCRAVMELRMRFIPYLHAAFVRYQREGLPPFRALVLDYPDDPLVRTLSDEYLMGDSVLVAPIIVRPPNRKTGGPAPTLGNDAKRSVYLPDGEWHDFWTGERYKGNQRIQVSVTLDRIPLFVKSGTILPLAKITTHTDDPDSWELTAQVYGDGSAGARLYEDDGGYTPSLDEMRLAWDAAAKSGQIVAARPGNKARYSVVAWKQMQ